jgi:hypothetical protein
MKTTIYKFFVLVLTFSLLSVSISAQRRGRGRSAPPPPKTKQIIFAVLNDGTTLEPIAHIERGKLTATVNGSDEPNVIAAFTRNYYKPKGTYNMIFAGVNAGNVTIKSSDPKSDCAKNMATITATSSKAKLKGKVMALATNATVKSGTGVRRLPTAAERKEIESLVREQFIKNNIPGNATGDLKYQNLTALDVDGDGKAEMVGSFWVEPSNDERALLFFIADKKTNGKYAISYNDFRWVKKDDVMSGEVKDLDGGIYHELLLDTFDYDGDGTSEIFTYSQSFEGAGFTSYKRTNGQWLRSYEYSNYHCGY